MRRSVHDSLYRSPTASTKSKVSDANPRSKLSTNTSRNTSVSSFLASPPHRAPRRCPVRMIYSIVNDSSHVESEEVESSVLFYSNPTNPDDRDTPVIRLHADHVFCEASAKPWAGDALTQQLVESAIRGEDSVLSLVTDTSETRCETFLHSDNGLVATYCEAMMSELEASGLSQLCAIRYTVVRLADDQLHQRKLDSSSNDVVIASLADADENAMHIVQTSSDVTELLSVVTAAAANTSDHIILVLRVAPVNLKSNGSHILKGLCQLMKPLGSVCFALVGAATPHSTKKTVAALRHSNRILVGVLAAITRQWHRTCVDEQVSPSVPTYIPFRDDSLTQALEPFLDKATTGGCTAYFWLHLDGSTLKPASSEFVHLAESLCAARFPNGRPPINFASLARHEHQAAVKLRQELADLRRQWDAERSLLESDRLMLRKACDAASFADKPLAITAGNEFSPQHHRDPTANRDKEALQMTKMMLATCQREKTELEQTLADLQTKQIRLPRSLSAVELLLSTGVLERTDSSSAIPEPQWAIAQLVQQLQEREKVLHHSLPEHDPYRKTLLNPTRWAQLLGKLQDLTAELHPRQRQPADVVVGSGRGHRRSEVSVSSNKSGEGPAANRHHTSLV